MARAFLTRSNDDDDDHLMANIASREHELASYDANIAIYDDQLKSMSRIPDAIPDGLLSFRGKTNEQIIAMGATDEQAATASEFNHRERVRMLRFTEEAEMKKSQLAYESLLNQLPEGPRRDAAMKRWQAKQDK